MRQFRGEATHVISVVDREDKGYIPSMGVAPESHLVLVCDDVESRAEAKRRERAMPGSRCIAPTRMMVRRALNFASSLSAKDTLLVHCGFGISRSPAIVFAILCQAYPDLPEEDVFDQILHLRPQASPNALIVSHADSILARNGKMLAALK